MSVVLELERVEAGHGARPFLPPISLAIEQKEVWALLGRNGSGKSTLLDTMLGLLPPIRGQVKRRANLKVSFVAQRREDDLLVPARVIDHVRGGVDQGWSFLEPALVYRSKERIERAMERTEVLEFARKPFDELSEGQKQRVLIARAIVSEPELLVLDEPTSAMDPVAEAEIAELLVDLSNERGMTVVMASHQMSFGPRFATHAIYVDGERGVAEIGPVEEILKSPMFRKRYESVMRHA